MDSSGAGAPVVFICESTGYSRPWTQLDAPRTFLALHVSASHSSYLELSSLVSLVSFEILSFFKAQFQGHLLQESLCGEGLCSPHNLSSAVLTGSAILIIVSKLWLLCFMWAKGGDRPVALGQGFPGTCAQLQSLLGRCLALAQGTPPCSGKRTNTSGSFACKESPHSPPCVALFFHNLCFLALGFRYQALQIVNARRGG